ncbi:MAG: S-layer homology domain-containing protein [Oscillospiraceae bacterium]|nr:S-layer homology domain-containing protein [Oscillospiraceae bacterium]
MNKRVICAGMAAVAAVSCLVSAVNVSADVKTDAVTAVSDDHSDGMTEAVKLARSRIDIPAECNDFTSSINESNGKKTYDLYWNAKNSNSSVSVSVCDGMITSCYIYKRSNARGAGISPYTDAQLESKAKAVINKLIPEAAGRYRLTDTDSQLSSNTVTLSFERICRDVPVKVNDIAVVLDKYTGELSSFYCTWYNDAVFIDPAKALSQQAIKEKYKKDVKPVPSYFISTDKSGKKTAFVRYSTNDDLVYDAVTGDTSALKDDLKKYNDTDTYYAPKAADYAKGYGMGSGAGNEDYELSEEEQEEADALKGKLTSEQFRKIVEADPYLGITARYHTDSFSVSRSYDDKSKFVINASYIINTEDEDVYCSVSADAVTGQIYSFYRYDSNGNYGTPDNETAAAVAKEAVSYYLGGNAVKYRLSTPADNNDYDGSRSLTFNRYENNILVNDNDLYITVNGNNEITSFNYTYTEKVDFGDGRIISADRAMERLLEQKDLTLGYDGFADLTGKSHLYLTYSMDTWYINAVTGELCDYEGKPADKNTACPYTDIESSPYKDEIIALYTYGVDITGNDKLEPQKNITQDEFSDLLQNVGNWDPILYSAKGEKGKDSSTVNSLDAATGFVSAARLSDAAELKGIYSVPVKNVKSDDKDYGTIAVAYALGVVDEDFAPDHIITREEALHLIYSYSVSAGKR